MYHTLHADREGNARQCMDAINNGGISRFFVKPCDPLDLIISIRQGLQQKKLMSAAYRLLQKNVRHVELLKKLEKQYPNITKVDRDSDGAIRIEDFHGSLPKLLEEIDTYLEKD